jgi:hypothetical protein
MATPKATIRSLAAKKDTGPRSGHRATTLNGKATPTKISRNEIMSRSERYIDQTMRGAG